MVEAWLTQDAGAGLDIINRLMDDGVEPRQFAHELVEYLRALMLVKLGDGASLLNLPEETLVAMQSQAARTDAAAIVRATTLFNTALVDIKSGLLDIPQLPLELAFVAAVQPLAAPPLATAAASLASATPERLTSQSEMSTNSGAPAPARATSASPVISTAKSNLTIETVRACFDQVLQDIEKKNKIMAEALRNQARLYRVSGREIQFVTSELMKKRFEKPQPQTAINEAFSAAIGQTVVVHFMLDNLVAKPGNDQGADQDLGALLKTAQDLGGQVVE
jgi:DNA polymerase-3 subunit gamma/tau